MAFMFPHTDFNRMNLDWIMQKLKAIDPLLPMIEGATTIYQTCIDLVNTVTDDAQTALDRSNEAAASATAAAASATEAQTAATQAGLDASTAVGAANSANNAALSSANAANTANQSASNAAAAAQNSASAAADAALSAREAADSAAAAARSFEFIKQFTLRNGTQDELSFQLSRSYTEFFVYAYILNHDEFAPPIFAVVPMSLISTLSGNRVQVKMPLNINENASVTYLQYETITLAADSITVSPYEEHQGLSDACIIYVFGRPA